MTTTDTQEPKLRIKQERQYWRAQAAKMGPKHAEALEVAIARQEIAAHERTHPKED